VAQGFVQGCLDFTARLQMSNHSPRLSFVDEFNRRKAIKSGLYNIHWPPEALKLMSFLSENHLR